MNTEKNIWIAFVLNLLFSVVELIGGIVTGSAAIVSDAVHDAGDAASIGLAFFLERKSKRPPDETYTYGYARYSVMGSLLTTAILLLGSAAVIYHSVCRFFRPGEIHYRGMIVLAVVGVAVNFSAAFFTRGGGSINQRAVNLHMLEDVLGWAVVLVGAVVMHFTDFALLDPIMSVGLSIFILIKAAGNLKEAADVLLEKAPHHMEPAGIREHLGQIDGVLDVHHIHLWTMDGRNHCATLHVVTDDDPHKVKEAVRKELGAHGVGHAVIETETALEHCDEKECSLGLQPVPGPCCHHHGHHSH